MKILIGTVDVCGWISVMAEELKRQGHEVITVSEPNKFNSAAPFDIDPRSYTLDFLHYYKTHKPLTALLITAIYRLCAGSLKFKFDVYIYNYSRRFFSSYCDAFIYLWNGLATDESDLLLFKKAGKKIITWFVGDDVRDYPTMEKEFNISTVFYEGYFKKEISKLVFKLRMHEKYADVIYSVPDQMSLALRPYYHLQIPVQVERFNFNITGNNVPVVIHIPSSPQIKGTAVIRQAIEDLKKEGLNFVYKELMNIPNAEVLKELSHADILADELFLHGPGVLSFEAMASGCAVATRFLENASPAFTPPVVAITEHTVKEKLRLLITDHDLRNELIEKGRAYVIANNPVQKIVSAMMSRLEEPALPDYVPSYFREKFEPLPEQVGYLNEQTNVVKQEPWYKKYIQPGERAGLQF